MSGSGISWAICKSALCSRQTSTPAPHHSVFYRLDALPAAQPTASKHWRHKLNKKNKDIKVTLTYNQLPYLTPLLIPYTLGHSLHSRDKHLLSEPAVSTVICSWGISYAAPSIWNKLTLEICNRLPLFASSASFTRNLKTYYFPVPSHSSNCPHLRFGHPVDHVPILNRTDLKKSHKR